jgi:hypothetical protein
VQGSLFETAPDSRVAELLAFASCLANFRPELLKNIGDDLEAHALAGKQRRLDERRWRESQTKTLIDVAPGDPPPLRLEAGRPRIAPLCVLAFLLLRGWFGKGYKDERLKTLSVESLSLRNFVRNQGCSLPAASTLEENLNAVSGGTLQKIHRAELALALDEGLDDFKTIRADSTAVASVSSHPTDSGTLAKLLCRMCSRLEKLERLGLERCGLPGELAGWKDELGQLKYRIGTLTSSSARQAEEAERRDAGRRDAEAPQVADSQSGAGNRESPKMKLQRNLYEQLYALGEAVLPRLETEFGTAKTQIRDAKTNPREQRLRERFIEEFEADIESTKRGIEQSRRRVCEGKKPGAAGRMPLSVSDSGASFILKGGWDMTFGYRPQLSFSAGNLVAALLVPEGNAADQGQYIPLVGASIANTGVVPTTVSTDDGYTGADQLAGCKALGVEIVSFSGARGKALLGDSRWESEPYREARRARNGAESGIGVLKAMEGFGQLRTCGIARVRAELLGKVIGYNALKIVSLRKRKHEKEHRNKWNAGLPGGNQAAA